VALVAAGHCLVSLAGCDAGDGDDADAATDATTVATAPAAAPTTTIAFDEEGSALESLLARSRDLTIHLVYEASAGVGEDGQPLDPYTLEVFRSDGRTRQDTTTDTGQGIFRTAGLLVDGEATVCQQQPGDEWICSVGAADEGSADGVFGTLLDGLRGLDLTEGDDTIDGLAVTCFSYEDAAGPGSICLDERGVPVRVITPTATLELTASDDDVPASAFEPPAEPVQAPEGG
jgi:hypothetical protein